MSKLILKLAAVLVMVVSLSGCSTSPAKQYVEKVVEGNKKITNYKEGEIVTNHDASILYIKYQAKTDFLRVTSDVFQKIKITLSRYKYNTLTYLYKDQEDAERRYNVILDRLTPSYDRRLHGWRQLVSYDVEGISKSYYVYYGYRYDYYNKEHVKIIDDSKVIATDEEIRQMSTQISSDINYFINSIDQIIESYKLKSYDRRR